MSDWLFLHGFAGGSETWDEVRRLMGLETALAPRLAGHELCGEQAASGQTFEDEVERLAALCEGPVAVCGYSLGGRLALGLASAHPDLVTRLVLIGANPGLTSTEARDERWRSDDRWASLLDERGKDEFFERWLAQPLFASQLRLDPSRRGAQDAVRERLQADGLSRAMRQMSLARMRSYWDALSEFRVPVDLVVGGEDSKFQALAGEMCERASSGSLHVVEGVGHNVVLEAPAALVEILKGSLA